MLRSRYPRSCGQARRRWPPITGGCSAATRGRTDRRRLAATEARQPPWRWGGRVRTRAVAASQFAAGLAIERLAYRPLRGSFRLAPLISAIGMSIFLSNLVQVTQG